MFKLDLLYFIKINKQKIENYIKAMLLLIKQKLIYDCSEDIINK